LVLCLLLLVWRQYLTTQPRWLRERVMQSKRTRGPPRCTKPGDKVTVSVVVTDVKGKAQAHFAFPVAAVVVQ
jgi:hypothetical protein